MLFYTKKGLYTCYGMVQKRYKKDNFFMLAMLLTSDPVKFQRREFFRIENNIELRYVPVPEEIAYLESTEELFAKLQAGSYIEQEKKAITRDISGGGIRFVAEDQLERGIFVVVVIRLCNDRIDQTFYLVTQVVDAQPSKNSKGKFIHRGKFLFKDLKDRETIVRYVFEEERRIRRKEMT
jgi:c-di-GMP-binding flagellar brake protein YcgR